MQQKPQNMPKRVYQYARAFNPYADFPTTPGSGVLLNHHLMRDVEVDDLYFVGTAQSNDGNVHLVYGTIPNLYLSSIPMIVMNSQSIYVEWDENGIVIFWAAN